MFQRSDRFPKGCVHGFSTRRGGVSEGPYASMNLGTRWGDAPAAVKENLGRLASAAGFDATMLRVVRQVHGRSIVAARDVDARTEADAIWCHRGAGDAGLVAGVYTADCVPVLLVDGACEVAAAIHAGWRGVVAGIVARTVETLAGAGIDRVSLYAVIGPCIESDAFEVGEDVAEQFAEVFVLRRRAARPHVDLVAAVHAQLAEAGLDEARIDRVGGCTHAQPERYFSYRRDGAGIGQHLSFVGLVG